MKKIVCILLTLVLAFGLFACGGSKTEETAAPETQAVLQIGYGREKIMPDDPVPLGGYGETSNRFSTNNLDYLYGTCIAASDGTDIVLFFTVDMILPVDAWVTELRQMIQAELDIPEENILVSYTHTHSAPDPWSSEPVMKTYRTKWMKMLTKAAKDAVADLAPATIYGTTTELEGMNFIRHYQLNDGRQGSGAAFMKTGTPVAHTEPNDPEMLLVKFDREGDKQDVLLMNWQAHPCFTGGMYKTDLSADYISVVRKELELETEMHFAFFQGAAGNHNTNSEIESEAHNLNNDKYGKKLAETALVALENLQPISGTDVKITRVDLEYNHNHADDDKISIANEVVNIWQSQSYEAADAYALANGLSSPHHARAIRDNVKRPQKGTMELDAVSIGGFAFVTAPYEMFGSHGTYIKSNSPFELTMVFECSNQYRAYIPTAAAYDYGCYESWTAVYDRGAGEAAAEKFVEMLNSLK